jgi:hypothetical protein
MRGLMRTATTAEKRETRGILRCISRSTSLFRYDPHLTVDTILAVAQVLKNYEYTEA